MVAGKKGERRRRRGEEMGREEEEMGGEEVGREEELGGERKFDYRRGLRGRDEEWRGRNRINS